MKKVIFLFAILPLLSIGQNRFGIAVGGSYGKTASFSLGFTSQRVAGPIGFNVDFKGPSEYQYQNKVTINGESVLMYKPTKIKYSILVGINANIKRFAITANGGFSLLSQREYSYNTTGQEPAYGILGCYEGLIGYNLVEKEKYVINLRAGYNNQYGGLLNLGFLF